MSCIRTHIGAPQVERSNTVLALLAMLLQLFFATAHLSTPLANENLVKSSGLSTICSENRFFPIKEAGQPVVPVPLDSTDCSICSYAAMAIDQDIQGSVGILAAIAKRVQRVEFTAKLETKAFLFPRAGTSRAPPLE